MNESLYIKSMVGGTSLFIITDKDGPEQGHQLIG